MFESLFLAFGPCINGFGSCCRLVIAIDGTHLKGKYMSVMFVATLMDDNEQIYPLAFGFSDRENDQSYAWFLTEFRNVIGSPPTLLIISYRYISI